MRALILTGFFIMSSLGVKADASYPSSAEQKLYGEINHEELAEWYRIGKEMVVVDARSKPYYDGTLLPHAKWLPYDASEEVVHSIIPAKNSLVVIYCWSSSCPASQYLIDRLLSEGYTQLYKYSEGLHEWIQNGYPVDKK